jgi:hypothetical protein
MWFAFGVITLAGFVVGFITFRTATRWSPQVGAAGGQQFLWSETRNRGKLMSARVGVPVQTDLEFRLKHESLVDRFFKALGLSVEQELNRLHFDQHVYVVSDDRRLGRLLKYHETLATRLGELFSGDELAGFSVVSLNCNGQHLFFQLKPKGLFSSDASVESAALALTPLLHDIAGELSRKLPDEPGRKDRFILKAAVLLGISTGLAAHAFINIFRLVMIDDTLIIDEGELLKGAIVIGLGITALLVAACIGLLGRTSRMHLVLVELITIGLAGAVGSAWVQLRDVNHEWDKGPVFEETLRVESLRTYSCGRRNRSTCYSVSFAPSPVFPHGRSVTVDAVTYSQYTEGGEARMTVHAGGLGIRWAGIPEAR